MVSRIARNAQRAATVGALAGLALLASCGGGGGSAGVCLGSVEVCNPNAGKVVLSADRPSSAYAETCDMDTEKKFVRSYLDEVYLWPDEIPATDSWPWTVAGYFYNLLVTTPDIHGLPKDRFSFIVSRADSDTLSTGAGMGFGVQWETDTAGRTRVAKVDANSPAARAGLARGGVLEAIVTATHQGWYPNVAGAMVTFTYRDAPGAAVRTVQLTTATVQEDPLPQATVLQSGQGRRVGYLQFDSHASGAQDKLIPAMRTLAAANVQELVLDMRYNPGGYLYVAQALASMVTGPANDSRVFERLAFNRKLNVDPADAVLRFSPRTEVAETVYPAGTALPRLSLSRVYVLATGGTCSASESVINSLRGVDIDVVIVGGTTCGKPYGFRRRDNCELSLYPIEFQGFNAKDYGDFSVGFAPTCPGADDFSTALGNPAEGLLGIALRHIDIGACTASTASTAAPQSASAALPQSAPLMSLDTRRPAYAGRVLLNKPARP